MDQHWLPVPSAARMLVDGPSRPAGVLVALHGYGQLADALVDCLGPALAAIGWGLCCPEAPHRFHPSGAHGAVGASWMTRHGREHDIVANRRYLATVFEHLRRRWSQAPVALLGFSQGASQCWRLAHERGDLALLLAVGGDIPPELHAHQPPATPPVVLLRGDQDRIYSAERQAADAAVLTAQGWDHRRETVPGGHELGPDLATVVARECRAVGPAA